MFSLALCDDLESSIIHTPSVLSIDNCGMSGFNSLLSAWGRSQVRMKSLQRCSLSLVLAVLAMRFHAASLDSISPC